MVLNTAPTTRWLLLRGLTREAAHWGDFPAVFRAALPGAQLHLPDLPGNGTRHTDRSPASVAGLVAACRAERQRLGMETPVHLLAMSLGAMVATEWAYTAPHELAGMVLINTSLRPFSPFHQRLLPHNYPTLARLALARMPAGAAEAAVFGMTCNHGSTRAATVERWTQARLEHPVSPGNALRQLLAAARYRAPLQAPAVPTLLLGSAHDRLVSHRCSQAIARAWGVPLRTHPSAGHDLPQDDAQWVVQRVQEWLESGAT